MRLSGVYYRDAEGGEFEEHTSDRLRGQLDIKYLNGV